MRNIFHMIGVVAGYSNKWQAGKKAPGTKNGPKRQNPRVACKSPVIYW